MVFDVQSEDREITVIYGLYGVRLSRRCSSQLTSLLDVFDVFISVSKTSVKCQIKLLAAFHR